jgi:mannose-6-phosphate isomerase
MTASLYPLKFRTLYKDKIWGGQKIRTVLGKDFGDLPNCGETWEISGVPGNLSVVRDGDMAGCDLASMIDHYRERLMGHRVFERFAFQFPLLVKFIDANDDLSIQVHPGDALARQRHNSFGKTEMWYVFQADPGARLQVGFNRPLGVEEYMEYFRHKKLMDILNFVEVHRDDVFFLPAGRVHSIGKGCLLAEIQQSSDITYRIYDFDRVDSSGTPRALHTEQALDAIDFTYHGDFKTRYPDRSNEAVELVRCEYFTTNRIAADRPLARDYSALDSFVIYVCMEGALDIEYAGGRVPVRMGDAVLLPAELKQVRLVPAPACKMLESYIAG